MLSHSFVLDALDTTAADTFSHFEMLIEEHIEMSKSGSNEASRLKKLVPTVGTFHTPLPLRKAFVAYNKKYALTKRRHITISFNELRHIMNLAQVMALHNGGDGSDKDISSSLERWEKSPGPLQGVRPPSPPPLSLAPFRADQTDTCSKDDFKGPKMITFDGDQTLYSDGANFESNQELASYLYLLLRNGVTIAVVTAAGYEYQKEKYELRLSGLLKYFQDRKLPARDCERFFLFGGECNYLLTLGADYRLCPVKERGGGGWMTSTSFIKDSPANWDETAIQSLLDVAEKSVKESIEELKIRGKSIRKKRSVGLIPNPGQEIPREILDESVLRAQEVLDSNSAQNLSFCAFNGGRDVWVDVGNKRVGVHILSSYLGMSVTETLHIGDQFLNTGNDFAARDICPCIWITCKFFFIHSLAK